MAQQLFTIEARVDFRDKEKIPLFQKLIQQAARLVITQAEMLGDSVKPEVVIYAHDYFKGHQDIKLFDDDIMNGAAALTDASNLLTDNHAERPTAALTDSASASSSEEISPELLAAMTK